MFDSEKVKELMKLGFTTADIVDMSRQAQAAEKAADAMHIAFKASMPSREKAPAWTMAAAFRGEYDAT